MSDLRLVLRQGGHRWTIARADAPAADLTVTFSAELPRDARPGAAVLELTSRQKVSSSLGLRLS